jgi:hypothetical protein
MLIMKKSLIYLLFTFCSFVAVSQSIVLTPHANPVIGSSDDFELYTVIDVENTSDTDLSLKASRQLVGTAPQGSSNYFCWDLCYPANVSFSSGVLNVEANTTNETSFSIHYQPNATTGSAVVKYCVFDENNIADSACVNISYSTESTSIADLNNDYFSEFHPNPSNSLTSIDYDLKMGQIATIIVSDMLGSVVFNETIYDKEGSLSFDFSNQKSGLYFANIIIEGEVKTMKRLVITD